MFQRVQINTLQTFQSKNKIRCRGSYKWFFSSKFLNTITNFDSNVKTKLDVEGVISGSSQVTITESQISDLSHYGDSDVVVVLNDNTVISGSSQISLSGFSTTNLSEGTNVHIIQIKSKN